MFGWLFHPGRSLKRGLRNEARGWNHTNFLGKPKRSMSMRQFSANMAGVGPRESRLNAAFREVRKLKREIKNKDNQILQMKRINKAQKPMKTDQVNEGTYAYYNAGLKRVMALLNSGGAWDKVMVPGIRAEVNGLLGTNSQWRSKR